MKLSPALNDEYYESSLIEHPVCLIIVDEILQQGLEHLQHSLLVPYMGSDLVLAICCCCSEHRSKRQLSYRTTCLYE